jgi:hypothetical protein
VCVGGGGRSRSVPCELDTSPGQALPIGDDEDGSGDGGDGGSDDTGNVIQQQTCGTGDTSPACEQDSVVDTIAPPTSTLPPETTTATTAPACLQWNVAGTWSTMHGDGGYHPTFAFTQTDTTITGTATVPAHEQEGAGYSGSGTVAGSLVGDQLVVDVQWPGRDGGPGASGTYTATITSAGLQNGKAGPVLDWIGSGPAVCVRTG